MSKITVNKSGSKTYFGLLTQEEIYDARRMLEKLIQEMPEIEGKLKKKYGDSLEYKFNLGEKLREYINRENIPEKERVLFWHEIEDYASKGGNPSNRSETRSFYEYCFILNGLGINTVRKMSWRCWNDLLDRNIWRQDKRIFNWISLTDTELSQSNWRDFVMGLNVYLKKKDTIVFDDKELYAIFDQIFETVKYWHQFFKEYFSKDLKKLSSARRNKLTKYKKKYFFDCGMLLRSNSSVGLMEICRKSFEANFVIQETEESN